MTFEEVLGHFPGSRKPNGSGGFMVPCPAHKDDRPSLSISPGNGSGPLFKCHGGCDTEAVLSSAGLTWRDILPPREKPTPRKSTIRAYSKERYEIRDSQGDLVAVHVREDSSDGKKMWWEAPDGTPKLGRPAAALPLYAADRIPARGAVIVTEGEKAADALLNNGIPAVGTVTGASGTPCDNSLRPLLGHLVYLWPDNDTGGLQHMERIAEALKRLGHRDLHMIEWKAAPVKGDAADLFTLEGATDELAVLMDEAKPLTPAAPPLFEPLATLLARPLKPVWLVKQLIETPSTNLIFGTSGSGKSFVAVDLAGAAATGGLWMGRAVTPGPVFYIAGEGRIGLLRRFQAWQLQRGIRIPADRLFLSTARIEISEIGAEAIAQEVERRAMEIGAGPVLLIIDTLARAMPAGGNENAVEDMMAFVNHVDQLRDRFQCTVFIVHHSGVADDKRARGSTSLKAAMDAELCITDKNGVRLAEWTKMKDLPKEPAPEGFVLERVLLDEDDDGEFVTSAVVRWEGQASIRTNITTTKAENLGLETLRALTVGAGNYSASVDAWRAEFYGKHWGDDQQAKKKAFARIRESLSGKGLIQIVDGLYSLKAKEDRGTKRDNVPPCPGAVGGQKGTHSFRSVPLSPSLVSQEEEDHG